MKELKNIVKAIVSPDEIRNNVDDRFCYTENIVDTKSVTYSQKVGEYLVSVVKLEKSVYKWIKTAEEAAKEYNKDVA